MESWLHPVLGSFHLWSADIWVAEVESAALSEFGTDTTELWLSAPEIEPGVAGPPKEASVDFAVKVLERLPELIPQCVEALWGDLTGTGDLNSGSWWRGGLEEMFRDPVNSLKDLYGELSPVKIKVGARSWRDHTLSTWIDFNASFDDEHGASFVTDGNRITGLGLPPARPTETGI